MNILLISSKNAHTYFAPSFYIFLIILKISKMSLKKQHNQIKVTVSFLFFKISLFAIIASQTAQKSQKMS